jgi:L-ascorbate metabolism protein UlaG (beta-lactamase superfamily)
MKHKISLTKKLFFIGLILVLTITISLTMENKKHTYLLNSKLSVIKEGWKGNLLIGDKFVNGDKPDNISFSAFLKWQFSKNPQKLEKKRDTFRLEVIANHNFMKSAEDMIVWLGHASFFIRINGVTILTDPCYHNMPFVKRLAGLPCNTNELKGIDYVLISHNHRDHFDNKSIKEIFKNNPNAIALVPLRTGKLIEKLSGKYEDAGWYQKFSTSDKIKIYFMPSHHWCRRGLTDNNEMLWGSFIIQTDSATIYFAGDTKLDTHFEEISKFFPKIDYALMPIGAYMPTYIMKQAHMSPQEAVEAANNLKTKIFVPMHYATYDLSDEPIGEPLRLLRKLKEDGILKSELKVLKIGEELDLK